MFPINKNQLYNLNFFWRSRKAQQNYTANQFFLDTFEVNLCKSVYFLSDNEQDNFIEYINFRFDGWKVKMVFGGVLNWKWLVSGRQNNSNMHEN